MRERFNAVVNDTVLLRWTYAPGGTPTDVDTIIKVEIFDEDPRTNPSAIPILTIDTGDVVHESTGEYSYVMLAQSDAGLYYDKIYFKPTAPDPEESEVQQVVVNQEVSIEDPDPLCPHTSQQRSGYAFGNYEIPADCWGAIGTSDDLRYHYLFGIDLKAQNGQEASDEQLAFVINAAMEEFERYLGIVIKKRIYKTNPEVHNPSLKRGLDVCDPNIDYTDIEDEYDFRPRNWRNYGKMQLKHFPVLSIERAKLYAVTKAEIADLIGLDWLRLDNRKAGLISIYPKKSSFIYGPPTMAAGASWLWLRSATQPYPGGFEFDYTAGYENSDLVDRGLREIILRLAAIGALQWVGDGLLAGFSSSSLSLDGLSESFSSTQSATSAYFGARILSYQNEIKAWLKKNRYKFSNFPLSFL